MHPQAIGMLMSGLRDPDRPPPYRRARRTFELILPSVRQECQSRRTFNVLRFTSLAECPNAIRILYFPQRGPDKAAEDPDLSFNVPGDPDFARAGVTRKSRACAVERSEIARGPAGTRPFLLL